MRVSGEKICDRSFERPHAHSVNNADNFVIVHIGCVQELIGSLSRLVHSLADDIKFALDRSLLLQRYRNALRQTEQCFSFLLRFGSRLDQAQILTLFTKSQSSDAD